MNRRNNRGFTIAEALTICIAIGVITALTVPAVLKKQSHHDYKTITRELAKIEAAKQEAAFANGWTDSKVVSLRHDLVPTYLPGIPDGPLGAGYVANSVGAEATYQGKSLDEWKASCDKEPDSPGCGL